MDLDALSHHPSVQAIVRRALAGDDAARAALTELQHAISQAIDVSETLPAVRIKTIKTLINVKPGGPATEREVAALVEAAGSPCDRAMARGLLAYLWRIRGRIGDAEAILREEIQVTIECPGCQADLYRRLALVLLTAGRHDEALGAAAVAVGRYEAISTVHSHDLDAAGLKKSLQARGRIRAALGDVDGAAEDCEMAITAYDAHTQPDLYAGALVTLAGVLVRGDERQVARAEVIVRDVARFFRGTRPTVAHVATSTSMETWPH